MKTLLISIVLFVFQDPVTVTKNNGDQFDLSEVTIYQNETSGSSGLLSYSYRGEGSEVAFSDIKRISFKETVKRKKGITTYRVILVKSNNSKLEIEVDLVKLEGTTKDGKKESMNFSSIDKISF